MKLVELGKIIAQAKVRRAGDMDYPVLSMTMRDGLVNQFDKFKKRIASADTSPYKVVERNQLVVGFPIDEGVLAFQNLYDAAIVSPAYNIWNLQDDAAVDSKYLEKFLRSPRALSFYKSKLRSTTARRRSIPNDEFLSLPVPVPPLAEQERIVKLLDEADELRKIRAKADNRTANLIPALFNQMFGDPVANSRGWQTKELRQLGRVVTGSTPPSAKEEMFGGEIPFITPGDLEKNTRATMRYVTEAGAAEVRTVRAGSTMVCCIGATIGKTDRTWKTSTFNQQINAVEWWNEIDDDFGVVCMKQSAKVVIRQGSQTALPILKKSLFEQIRIPVPPLPLQKEFAKRVAEIRELETAQAASRQRLESLFQSMLHRAFNGGL